jgi:dipeptidase D
LGNANKILNRYLWELSRKYKLSLAGIDGGNLHKAIAREAYAIAGVPYGDKEKVIVELNTLAPLIEAELKAIDPNLKMTVGSADAPAFVIDETTAINLLNSIYACPHGVLGMSSEIPGLVETSTNLASVKMKDNDTIVITTSQRSSANSLKDDAANMVNAVFTLAQAEVKHSAGYPGWKPNPESEILAVAKESYKKLSGKEAEIMAIHAGLECGLFLEKYPHLDMISCGPTIRNAHSPEEQIYIPSVEKWWDFLLDILKNIPAK